jgi:hypothetical protein
VNNKKIEKIYTGVIRTLYDNGMPDDVIYYILKRYGMYLPRKYIRGICKEERDKLYGDVYT